MTTYRHELPGDLLEQLCHLHQIPSVADFTRQHELRISEALEDRVKTLSGDDIDEIWEHMVLSYEQWHNRFAITWDSAPPWRALFRSSNLDALVMAQWFERDDPLYERFQNAMDLQNLRKLGVPIDEIEENYAFDEALDLALVFDTLCWRLANTLKDHPEASSWSFEAITSAAKWFSQDTLRALADLGIIDLPEGGLDHLPGWDQTRGSANPAEEPASPLIQRIYDWAKPILCEEIERLEASHEKHDRASTGI